MTISPEASSSVASACSIDQEAAELGEVVEEQDTVARERPRMYLEATRRSAWLGSLLAGEPLPGRLLRDSKRVSDLRPAAALPPSLGYGLADQFVDSTRRLTRDREVVERAFTPGSDGAKPSLRPAPDEPDGFREHAHVPPTVRPP